MSNMKTLIEILMTQKKLYSALLSCSESLNEQITTGSGDFAPLIVERDDLMEKLKTGDEKIGDFLSSLENKDLLETDEQANTLRNEIVAIVEKVKESGNALMESTRIAKDKTMDELASLGGGKKMVSGYGKTSRPVYAKFIDFKH